MLIALTSLYLLTCTVVAFFAHLLYRKYLERKMYESIYLAGIVGFLSGVIWLVTLQMLVISFMFLGG